MLRVIPLLLLSLTGVSCVKVWYGAPYRQPSDKNKDDNTIRPFITTALNDIDSPLVAVGVVWTLGMLDKADKLPTNTSVIPTLAGNYSVESIRIPLTFPTGNPFNPFKAVNVLYSKTGFPVGGLPEASLNNFNTSLWGVSFHFDNATRPNSYGQPGPCSGLSPAAFNLTQQPVAANCYPNTTNFRNIGDVFYGYGGRMFDLRASGFNTSQTFNTSFVFGQYNGSISYFMPVLSNAAMKRQSRDYTYYSIRGMPKNFPTKQTLPTQYATRLVNANTVVLELRSWKDFPAGDCTVSSSNPAAPGSYFPGGAQLPEQCTYPKP